MASHHHHYNHCRQPDTAAASCYYHCCCAAYAPCHHHHPPPPTDPQLHQTPLQPHFYSFRTHLTSLPQYPHHFQEEKQTHSTVPSLLRRIAALESALRRRSSHDSSSNPLRDAAARTIQTSFRNFLLRRSVTLRQLKELASIKSTLGTLKSSVSEKPHLDYGVIYHKVTNLLLKLDTIQGGDPMIRSGKISLSRELTKLLDFLERACAQKRTHSSGLNVRQSGNNLKSMVPKSDKRIRNVKSGCLKIANVEKLRGLVERINRLAEELDDEEGEVMENPNNGFIIRKSDVSVNRTGGLLQQRGGVQPKVKKNVTFVEDGKVSGVLRRPTETYLEEYSNDGIDRDDSVDDEKELEDDLCREIEEIGVSPKKNVEEEAEESSLLSSDCEKDSIHYSTTEGNFEATSRGQDDTDDFIFSAPLPVKMEIRGETVDKRKKLNYI